MPHAISGGLFLLLIFISLTIAPMDQQITAEKEVILCAWGCWIIFLTLVAVENWALYVCKREEFDLAQRKSREPICIGFPASDLVQMIGQPNLSR
ncbi:MAG: hypothetical protein WBD32_07910 [Acidobacteriaceae bacterium]